MTEAWWINHNATFDHEVAGGYLWSPQREKLARSTAYDNMRKIKRGDLVVSYADQKTRHVGRATDCAIAAPKPKEFGAAGAAWSTAGWYVPVQWTPLPVPFRHRDHWETVEPLLPKKYSPIVASTKRGNQKLYLAQISVELFGIVAGQGGLDLQTFLASPLEERLAAAVKDELEAEDGAVVANLGLDETEREQLVKARKGQGAFRAAVQRIEKFCRVTGLDHPDLLIASHIKPWWACETGTERLDGANGLMLAPHIDRMFDRGFISFTDEGTVLVSPHLSGHVLNALGCASLKEQNVGPFSPAQCVYLAYHRTMFLGG